MSLQLHGDVGAELAKDEDEVLWASTPGHGLPQWLAIDGVAGLDQVSEDDAGVSAVLRWGVEGLFDVVGAVDAAFSKHSATLLIQSNINEMTAKSSGDD